jgi:2',3'-cyclic-nucleotide 2'-phosphodiesterase/3'-nucleotidase/5'-nucleotidase
MYSFARKIVLGACVLASACASSAPPAAQVPERPNPVITDTATPPVLRLQRELVLLGTTDVHNRLYPHDYYTQQEIPYGLARLKPVIDSVRAANAGRTFLFDSGDLLQGNPLGLVYARQQAAQPNPVIRAMNLLAYDASTIGNHEYNYGLAHLNRALSIAKFPFVTGNVFKHGTNEHAYAPFVLIPHVAAAGDTILIGVTGNTPPGVHIWDRANVEGVLQFRRVVESLRPVVQTMKDRGADLIVVLSHGGFQGTSYDTLASGVPPENEAARLAREVPDIDVVFLGHTHRELADSVINGVTFTQARNWAQSLAAVSVMMERRDRGDWIAVAKKGRIIKPDPMRADTAFLDSMRWEHERTVAYVNSVAGTSTAAMDARESRTKDTPIIDFVNEVMRRTAGTQLSATAAFDINSRLPRGPVRIADIAGLYVYDNTLRAVRITGAQLRAFLEKSAEYFGSTNIPGYNFDAVTGVDYVIDISQPVGQRITTLTFNGAPVRDDQTFTMALNNYRQGGGGGFSMLAGAPVIYDKQEDIKELLIEEIRRRGTINPASYFKQNWRLVPAEAAAEVQRRLGRDLRSVAPVAVDPAKRLRVLATNDFHGRLLPEVYSFSSGKLVGGAVALDGYFREERLGFAGPTIILDGGDVMQGTPISNLTKGRSTVEFFNRAGYSAAAIGNHEFDWAVPVLRDRIKQARYGWLGANIYLAGTQNRPAWSKPTALVTVDGVKVGIIGLATEETPDVTKSSNVVGLEFRSGIAEIDRWVPQLRAQGADFVIVVAHSGAVCDRDFKKCDGEIIRWARGVQHKPDLIVAGHTHRLVRYVENGIPIVEANSYSTRYGVVDLVKDSAGARAWIRDFPTTYIDRVKGDDQIARLVQRYEREIGPRVKQVIATLADTISRPAMTTTGNGTDTPLGNLLADAFRVTANAQMSFVNNGSIRIAELPKGPVTWGQLYSLQPFENRMVRLTLTGAQIRAIVEQSVSGERIIGMHVSGIKVTYNPAAAAGSRVQRIQVGNEDMRDDATYTVAVTDFLATGTGDGYRGFGLASRREDVGLTDLEAVIRYLENQPQPVRSNAGDRRYVTQ